MGSSAVSNWRPSWRPLFGGMATIRRNLCHNFSRSRQSFPWPLGAMPPKNSGRVHYGQSIPYRA
jgi:hypothetical protein